MFHSESDGLRPGQTQVDEVNHLLHTLREMEHVGDGGLRDQTARQNGLSSAHSDGRRSASPLSSASPSDGLNPGPSSVDEDRRLMQALQEMIALCGEHGRPAQFSQSSQSGVQHQLHSLRSDRLKTGPGPADEETRVANALHEMESLHVASSRTVNSDSSANRNPPRPLSVSIPVLRFQPKALPSLKNKSLKSVDIISR